MNLCSSPRSIFSLLVLAALVLFGACEPGDDSQRQRQSTIEALQERAQLRPRSPETNFGYIHHLREPLDHRPGSPLSLQIDGAEVEIDDMALVISAIELHRCSVTNTLSRSVLELLIPSAHAHVPSSATRFGTPWVEDLLATPGSARMIGGIAPPPGTYCELHVILAPADDDVINITPVDPEDIEDHTFLARGRWRPNPNSPWNTFTWSDQRRQPVALPMIDPRSGASPVELHDPEAQVLFLLDKTLSEDLLQQVRIEDSGPSFTAFLDGLIETFSIYQY